MMPLMLLDTVGISPLSCEWGAGLEYFIVLARADELNVKR